jgi:hypothetical protein
LLCCLLCMETGRPLPSSACSNVQSTFATRRQSPLRVSRQMESATIWIQIRARRTQTIAGAAAHHCHFRRTTATRRRNSARPSPPAQPRAHLQTGARANMRVATPANRSQPTIAFLAASSARMCQQGRFRLACIPTLQPVRRSASLSSHAKIRKPALGTAMPKTCSAIRSPKAAHS